MRVAAADGGGSVATAPVAGRPSTSSPSAADIQAWNDAVARATGGRGSDGGSGTTQSYLASFAPQSSQTNPWRDIGTVAGGIGAAIGSVAGGARTLPPGDSGNPPPSETDDAKASTGGVEGAQATGKAAGSGTAGATSIPDPNDVVPGGPWQPAGAGQRPGTFFGLKPEAGPRPMLRWVPPDGQGGPPGSEGYWKAQVPGQKGWTRFDQQGDPITPEQAHPGPRPAPEPPPPEGAVGDAAGAAASTEESAAQGLLRPGGLAAGAGAGGAVGAVVAGGVTAWNDADQVRDQKMTAGQATADVAVQAGVGLAAGASGAAVGAAVGSVVPVAGTAVGAIVGFGVGMAVSWAAEHSGMVDGAEKTAGKFLTDHFEQPLQQVWHGAADGVDATRSAVNGGAQAVEHAASDVGNAVSEAWHSVF